jgi:stress response protein SCP2
MGLFNRSKPTAEKQITEPQITETQITETTAPAAGKVSLSKGSSVTLTKTSAARQVISVINGWKAKGKDYDLKALVRYRNDRLLYVGAANADEVLASAEGAVKHSGDARQAGDLETVTITWHPDIASVALSSYSALENGEGSFREYGVYVNIVNGEQTISLNASDASANAGQYTLCFGEVLFNEDETFTVVNLELYSAPGSENRVGYRKGKVAMDAGPVGQEK